MATVAPRLSARRWAYHRLPKALHPVAWWLWALGLAAAAARTTNPLLLGAIVGVVSWVVLARRSDAPWAHAFRLYVYAAVIVVALRVAFRVVFGGGLPGDVLVRLPGVSLPGAAADVHLFGDVTAQAMLGALYDGMRLATMLICVGGANALANPKRLLRSMPSALHEVSTAVVVALSVFPQLAESVVRVARARKLRSNVETRGIRGLGRTLVPILEDALDRSLALAASMDSRGYGRAGPRSKSSVRVAGGLLVLGLCALTVGVYALLDGTAPRVLAGPMLVAGAGVGAVAMSLAGRGLQRTAYRPDRWGLSELLVVASGLTATALVYVGLQADPAAVVPSLSPLAWPELAPLPLAGVLVGLAPAWVAPTPALVEAAS